MKRKRPEDDGDEAAAIKVRTNTRAFKKAVTFDDHADELLASVLLFMEFCERSMVRCVCRRLCQVIDSMPPVSLEVVVVSNVPEYNHRGIDDTLSRSDDDDLVAGYNDDDDADSGNDDTTKEQNQDEPEDEA